MHGIILPRSAIGKRGLSAPWETRMTSALIASTKGGSNYGYRKDTAIGSLTDQTVDPLENAQVHEISKATSMLYFILKGNFPQDSFDELLISTNTYLSSSAIYSYESANNITNWIFSVGVTSPFPDTGSNILVRLS